MLEILARDLAIKITPLSPALTPVYVKDYAFGDLSGMSFKNVRLTIPAGEKMASRRPGARPCRRPGSSALSATCFSRSENSPGPVILDNARPHGGGREVSYRFFG